jgi:hypothetical protein
MTTALQQAFVTAQNNAPESEELDSAPFIGTSFAHYDVLDTIETIHHPMLKAMVLGSMEWSISAAIINLARDTFYRVRDSMAATDNAIDDFNEFINAVAVLKANEQYNTDLGFEENTGALQQLAMLVSLKQRWYDQAELAHGAAKMVFKTKTYEELIATEKVRTVDGDMKLNLSALADFAGRGDKDRTTKAHEALVRQQQLKFASQHATRQLVAPAVINIITMAEYRGIEDVAFWQLPVETQQRLIDGTRKAIERSLETLATWRGITTIEYAAGILPDGFDAIKQLEAVLASAKFK